MFFGYDLNQCIETVVCVNRPPAHQPRYLDSSFLCTFVPGSENSTDGTFVPVELSFPGTFGHVERKVQELPLHGTFAAMELSLRSSECPKNFCSKELPFLGTFAPIL